MAKQSILTNKKILWGSAGVLLTSGVVAGVLVPVLTSKNDAKEKNTKLTLSQAVLNAQSSDDAITAMQKLYGLEIKKAMAVNDLEVGELKSKYQSASNLATFIFANKNTYQTLFLSGKEQKTNLQEIVMIMSSKNEIRKKVTTGNWPANQVDANDQFNFLITFFKEKVVKVTKLNAKRAVANEVKIIFKAKSYDLVNLFYQFKNTDPQANDFGYYNAYLDNENNTQGLALFKKYLLTLKAEDSTVTNADLTEVQFTEKRHNLATKTATAELRFSYQGLSTTKTISDFEYREIYNLTLKPGVDNKMADEVQIADIDTTNLPSGVSISNIEPSPDYPDGSVIKITFNGGTITSQNFPGLTSYQSKAEKLLQNSDFTITGQSENLPSTYNDKITLQNQLKAKANAIKNNNAKTKVKEILETATINFNANDQTGALSFTITVGTVNKTFVISDLDTFNSINKVNKRIDAEVARKTMPTIKPGSEWKVGARASIEDIIITPGDNTLISKIKNVSYKIGSIVTVTIEVSSLVANTKKVTYNLDIKGFTTLLDSANYQSYLLRKLQNSDFITIANKNILPSQFKNFKAIKTIIKEEIKKVINISEEDKNSLEKTIDSNVVITFESDDDQGILNFNVYLGFITNKRTFTVTGFKRI